MFSSSSKVPSLDARDYADAAAAWQSGIGSDHQPRVVVVLLNRQDDLAISTEMSIRLSSRRRPQRAGTTAADRMDHDGHQPDRPEEWRRARAYQAPPCGGGGQHDGTLGVSCRENDVFDADRSKA